MQCSEEKALAKRDRDGYDAKENIKKKLKMNGNGEVSTAIKNNDKPEIKHTNIKPSILKHIGKEKPSFGAFFKKQNEKKKQQTGGNANKLMNGDDEDNKNSAQHDSSDQLKKNERIMDDDDENRFNKSKSNSQPTTHSNKKQIKIKDPSIMYIHSPLRAPIVRQARKFFQSLGLPFDAKLGKIHGYRSCAKLCVRGNPPVIGLFEPGSHSVIKVNGSSAHHPSINKAIDKLEIAIEKSKLNGYDGVNHGGLSYITLNAETGSKKVQVVFVFNQHERRKECENKILVENMLKTLENESKDFWHSIWVHCYPASRHDNAIFGVENSTWDIIYGDKNDILKEIMMPEVKNHPTLYFHPQCFRQANAQMFKEILVDIRNQISKFEEKKMSVVELYGGVGTIGLHLIEFCQKLICSDENPYNLECFNKSIDQLSNGLQIAKYESKGASKMVRDNHLQIADLVIVDPPRKGMDDDVIQGILHHASNDNLKYLVYVSCGFKAFVRDYDALTSSNTFQAIFSKGYLLFPGSDHIETLCIFKRTY